MSYRTHEPRESRSRLLSDHELDRTVGAISQRAAQLGIQVDANAVATLYETGRERDGISIGKVVAIEHGLVFQSAGRGMGVVHAEKALDIVPNVGEMATIVMRNGIGRVSTGQSQDRGMGRI